MSINKKGRKMIKLQIGQKEYEKIEEIKFAKIKNNEFVKVTVLGIISEEEQEVLLKINHIDEIEINYGLEIELLEKICKCSQNVKIHINRALNVEEYKKYLYSRVYANIDIIKEIRFKRKSEIDNNKSLIPEMKNKAEKLTIKLRKATDIYITEFQEWERLGISEIVSVKERIVDGKKQIVEDGYPIEEQIIVDTTKYIKDVTKLPIEKLKKLRKQGIKYVQVNEDVEEYDLRYIYDIDTYIEIRKKLELIVRGTEKCQSESEKFRMIYERIVESIIYDRAVAYPKNNREKEYAEEQLDDSRNLKNGLLKGKCVCAGYAEILRNTLALAGIEAEYVEGDVVKKEVAENFSEEDLEKYKKRKGKIGIYIFKDEKEKKYIGERHAWVKCKIDGEWYNFDPTWDSGMLPLKWCYKTDAELSKKRKNITGVKCEHTLTEKEKGEKLGYKYIGKFRLPNGRTLRKMKVKLIKSVKRISPKKIVRKLLKARTNIKGVKSEQVTQNIIHDQNKLPSWDMRNYSISEKEKQNLNHDKEVKKNIKEDDELLL